MSLDNYSIQYLSKKDFREWDVFLDASPQTTIYAKSWYLEALQCSFKILVVLEQTKIIGGIVLAKNMRNDYANPLLCKYLGVYFRTFKGTSYNQETKRRKIIKSLLTELKHLSSFNYYFHPFFNSYLPFYQQSFLNQTRYSYWIDLKNKTIGEIRSNYHSKLRSELKYANGQAYKLAKDLPIDIFIKFCKKTFIQKGNKFPFSPVFLKNYIQQLKRHKAISLLGVYNQAGEIMAVAGLLQEKHTTSLILSGFDKTRIERGANEWLIDQCILLAKELSYHFDFEGSMLSTIEAFYRKFGGNYLPYLNIYKDSTKQYLLEKIRIWYRKNLKK